jgi:hypothetical protein
LYRKLIYILKEHLTCIKAEIINRKFDSNLVIMYKTHVLDCLHYLHIANIDCHNSSTSKRLYLRRNNPFYPRFF